MTTTASRSTAPPGPLVSLLGGRVEQFYAIDDKPEDTVPVTGTWGSHHLEDLGRTAQPPP